jgi:hypothetical protein
MVARLRNVLLGLLVACSCEARGLRLSRAVDAGGAVGSGGSQATSAPDASATVGGSGGSVGTGVGPSGGGGTGGQLSATAICVSGASVACECTAGLQGVVVHRRALSGIRSPGDVRGMTTETTRPQRLRRTNIRLPELKSRKIGRVWTESGAVY